ncbi:MAG: hypothetical protein PHS97_05095 [Oscillospiraceae bacterium]|nr:hypothetical protein [Oscillospiraceae bacterium]
MDYSAVCYQYSCARYPTCQRAAGLGCCLEPDENETRVAPGDCSAALDYPLFVVGRPDAGRLPSYQK